MPGTRGGVAHSAVSQRRSDTAARESTSSESEVDTPTGLASTSSAAHSPGSTSSSSTLPSSSAPNSMPPRLSRAFSMPVPSQLGLLQNPHRIALNRTQTVPIPEPQSALHSFSIELAEALQMVIQTLVQVSPPHLLDPAKEQLAACFLSLPTTSMSSLLISMKNLNYMAANTLPLTAPGCDFNPQFNDFDIGEMIQGVGDAMSGVAAQAGVDLVLYHGDIGMKHAFVRGDESGISCTLSHIVRQIISVSEPGDTVEIGLLISSREVVAESEFSEYALAGKRDLWAHLDITHRPSENATNADSAQGPHSSSAHRSKPSFQSTILVSLMNHIEAKVFESQPDAAHQSEMRYRLSVPLSSAQLAIEDAQQLFLEQDSVRQPFPNVRLASEPSLSELRQFAETLRGKKVAFYASASRAFAHRLTSYLTAWGMDVSHISLDREDPSTPNTDTDNGENWSNPNPSLKSSTSTLVGEEEPSGIDGSDPDNPAFIIIDDDVMVLRRRIVQLQLQNRSRSTLHAHKRPALVHRPKSSPHLRTFISSAPRHQSGPNVSIIHFTGISKYNLVRDLIQSMSDSRYHSSAWTPEIIAIPKPAGPRRFLTALYTAVNRPLVDPLFAPIATSPSSPSNSEAAQSPISLRHSKNSNGPQESKRSAPRSPRDPGGPFLGPTSPLAMEIEASDYFPDTAQRLGSSPASGVVIQSPDGQRAGIYFQPKPRPTGQNTGRVISRETQPFVAEPSNAITKPSVTVSSPSPRSKPQSSHVSDSASQALESKTEEQDANGSRRASLKSPKRTASAEPFARPNKSNTPAPKKQKANDNAVVPPINVLIVEDNPINQTILSTFMKRKRIKFETAADGVQAIEKYKKGNFHLILMDIQMPNMDGIEATKRIREIESNAMKSTSDMHTPGGTSSGSSAIIVALTASSLATDRVNALAAGCNDFLTKPVSLLWLNNKIIEWGSIKVLQSWAVKGLISPHRQRPKEIEDSA